MRSRQSSPRLAIWGPYAPDCMALRRIIIITAEQFMMAHGSPQLGLFIFGHCPANAPLQSCDGDGLGMTRVFRKTRLARYQDS